MSNKSTGQIRPQLSTKINASCTELYELPFIESKSDTIINYWSIKSTGDWSLDCIIGNYYALELCNYMSLTYDPILAKITDAIPLGTCGIKVGFLGYFEQLVMGEA